MRKQYLVLLIGLIVAAGAMFTTCDMGPYDWRFENHTTYAIQVESQDLTPSYFELAGYTGNEAQLLLPGVGDNPDVSSETAVSTKASPKIGYIAKNMSVEWTKNNIKLEQSGSVIRFKKISGEEGGFAKIELAD